MPHTLRCLTTGLIVVTAGIGLPAKDPPPADRGMPGDVKGSAVSGWHAPFVHYSSLFVDKSHLVSVRWFNADGKLRREHSGHISLQPGFLHDYSGERTVIWDIHGEWKFTLPRKEGASGYITSTPDGRIFFHQHHPAPGQIAVDVYIAGKLAGTVGPFVQYKGESLHHGDDGSLALVVWRDPGKSGPQVVVAGPDAKVRFKIDCGAMVLSPIVAPGGQGVLLHSTDAERNTFSFHRAMGKVSSRKPGFNAYCVTWLPESVTALMSSSIGHDYRFHLIDWSTGKELWDIRDPCPARVPGVAPRVAVAKDHLLFAGREYIKLGEKLEPVRCIYAVDVKTGKTAARWHPTPLRGAHGQGAEPWFRQHGKHLYLMTPEEFSAIDFGEMAARKSGWK